MNDEELIVSCPYCYQQTAVYLGSGQNFDFMVEDCQVCCNPIEIRIRIDEDGVITDFSAEKAY